MIGIEEILISVVVALLCLGMLAVAILAGVFVVRGQKPKPEPTVQRQQTLILCPQCGASNTPGNNYCEQCGTALASRKWLDPTQHE
ncbi:MAG: zinc-ribbon domain-containing protein [Anaerolineales bacterium]|nr:zinc-ribbon domain-containing protein [Anaerolineales bacterium]